MNNDSGSGIADVEEIDKEKQPGKIDNLTDQIKEYLNQNKTSEYDLEFQEHNMEVNELDQIV